MSLDPCLFVIFGATGDLAARKLLPAVCNLAAEGTLPPQTQVIGLGRSPKPKEEFQSWTRDALAAAGLKADQIATLVDERLHYLSIGRGLAEDFRALGQALGDLARTHGGRLLRPRAPCGTCRSARGAEV